ncbi:glycosyltransferase family 2 protein [Thioclava sp. GXIMD4215]|uniref:glycosyltransferase family 2 protein n=1 Tax=Thioclava sp. GXIMD4215 TaxID=3131928 RepID=UPI003249351E
MTMSNRAPDHPQWAVVGLMDEPAPLMAAWVAHHVAIGAGEVHVVFDRPDPPTEALLRGVSGCFVHRSGEDGWALHWKARRPNRHQARQKYHATRIANETAMDWIIHCDADEFVHLERPLSWELEKTREKAWLRLEVLERTFVPGVTGGDIFQGVFRKRWDAFAEEGAAFYGPRARFLNRGVSGHIAGKACMRTGQGYVLGVHHPTEHWDAPGGTVTLPYRPSYNARLTHFDGLTPLHYILKMMRRALTQVSGAPVPYAAPRVAQFEEAARLARDPQALWDHWFAVQGMTEAEEVALVQRDLAERIACPVLSHAQALFPELDFSPAGFDRLLLEHEEALVAKAKERLGFDAQAFLAEAFTG